MDGVTELDEKMGQVVKDRSRRLAAMSNSIYEEDLKEFGKNDANAIQTVSLLFCAVETIINRSFGGLAFTNNECMKIATLVVPYLSGAILKSLIEDAVEKVKLDGVTDTEELIEKAKALVKENINRGKR